VVIYMRHSETRVQFTCRTTSPINVIVINARSRLSLDDPSAVSDEVPEETLAIYGSEAILLPSDTLRRYVYVRQCLAFDRDIRLTLVPHSRATSSTTNAAYLQSPVAETMPFCSMNDVQTMLDTCAGEMQRVRARGERKLID